MRAIKAASSPDQAAPGKALRRAVAIWPWLLVAAAWALALLAVWTHQQYLINHDYLLTESGLPWLAALLLFLACWQVMTAAMMLPSSLPMVSLLARACRREAHPHRTMGAFLAGYAAVWTAFAIAAFLGDTLIHALVNGWPALARHPWLIGATTFALAGAFQFSPLKTRCLKMCRSPLGFFARFYHRGVGQAWRLGLQHGKFCLGCCWALMLVMFGIGVGSVVWMAALSGVMVIEKVLPGGQRLSPLIGVFLFVLAGLWLLHPSWLWLVSG
jgi:predicted metal-binding membrane protein